MSLKYEGLDIRAVLDAFARYTGRTIEVGKDVAGTVTTEIKDQPWDAALRSILTPLNLTACQNHSGIIMVDVAH